MRQTLESPLDQAVSSILHLTGTHLILNTLTGDVAISSASFILVTSQLQSLLTLIDLSRTVFNRVKFNFVSFHVFI